MQRHTIVPDVIAYNGALCVCEVGQQYQQALRLYGQCSAMPLCRLRSSTRCYRCVWKGQQYQQALHLLRAMQHCASVPEVFTYNVAIWAHKKGQQHQRALLFRRAMRRFGIVPERSTCNAAVSAYVKGQRRQEASHPSRAMRRQAVCRM